MLTFLNFIFAVNVCIFHFISVVTICMQFTSKKCFTKIHLYECLLVMPPCAHVFLNFQLQFQISECCKLSPPKKTKTLYVLQSATTSVAKTVRWPAAPTQHQAFCINVKGVFKPISRWKGGGMCLKVVMTGTGAHGPSKPMTIFYCSLAYQSIPSWESSPSY